VRAAAGVPKSAVLVVSGDALTDFDIAAMTERHYSSGAAVTVAATRAEDVSRYGVILPDPDGFIRDFAEKPAYGAGSDLVNCGIYIVSPEVFGLIPEGAYFDFSRDLFPVLLKSRRRLAVYDVGKSYWTDIGGTEAYFSANADVLSGRCRSADQFYYSDDCIAAVSPAALVSPDVRLSGLVCIGADAEIMGNVTIDNCVVLEGAKINCSLKDCIVSPDFCIDRYGTDMVGFMPPDTAFLQTPELFR
jgi:mannose-1-phosphate guanylyltransferase/phosphomannomutase